MQKAAPVLVQYGAIPYRITKGGALELLLATTKRSKRWIIPKGVPHKGAEAGKVGCTPVTPLAVHHGHVALGDALGRVHVFAAQEFPVHPINRIDECRHEIGSFRNIGLCRLINPPR
ncbi:hypothetical protein [Methylocella sp.]|jgi:hypothetical protein|uniref:hypothetical protein n=1 Tax=Methylocella sp. TaxID=1978226 RepID=UPI003C2A0A2A